MDNDIKIVGKYIVFKNSKDQNFTVAVNMADYKKYGLAGFNFTPKNVDGAVTFDNVKFVHGKDDYIVFKNTKVPNYTIAVNERDLKKNGYNLSGFNFRNNVSTDNAQPVNECFDY